MYFLHLPTHLSDFLASELQALFPSVRSEYLFPICQVLVLCILSVCHATLKTVYVAKFIHPLFCLDSKLSYLKNKIQLSKSEAITILQSHVWM